MSDVVETIEGATCIMRVRCDDRAGFEFIIVRANDSDFHLSIRPHREDFAYEHKGEEELFGGLYSASVRIRQPTIGGGSHPEVYRVLASLFAKSSRVPQGADKT